MRSLSEQLVILAKLTGTILRESYIEPGSDTAITVDHAGNVIATQYLTAPGWGAHGLAIGLGNVGTPGSGSAGITSRC
jgi:hypothetical protein